MTTLVTSWDGAIATTVGNVLWQVSGKIVILALPAVSGEGVKESPMIATAKLPAEARPLAPRVMTLEGLQGGEHITVCLTVTTDGTLCCCPIGQKEYKGEGVMGFDGATVFYFL